MRAKSEAETVQVSIWHIHGHNGSESNFCWRFARRGEKDVARAEFYFDARLLTISTKPHCSGLNLIKTSDNTVRKPGIQSELPYHQSLS